MEQPRSRILDTIYLFGAALFVCVFSVGAFALAAFYHIKPFWVFFGLVSVAFVAGAREDYHKEFRSPRFVAFVIGWVLVNIAVIIVFLSFFTWVWLIPALLLEQFLFYMTAYWFLDVPPPSKLRPFQRAKSSDGDNT